MSEPAYTLAMYRVRAGQEDAFVAAWNELADMRYEYRALRLKFGKADDASGAHVRVELAPPSKEALRAFEKFVGEGFAVRDLFLSGDRVGVILERRL